MRAIGTSRQGRTLYGLRVGNGPMRVSIVAGAHADEPVGPRTALHLAAAMARGDAPWAVELAQRATFWIVPHVHPDGEAANAEWIGALDDFTAWLRHATRDTPADDVEFHYPRSIDDRDTRPENLAVADFLRSAGAPFDVHASLHSMAFAEGAWFLICRAWADRARQAGLFDRLARAANETGLGLHDIDRGGEKGFHRLAPGVSTTPHSQAMRDFFLAKGDAVTAAHFRPSSMEFVAALGGDPLCLVSEIPHFVLRARTQPDPGGTYAKLRDLLPTLRMAALKGDDAPITKAVARFGIEPVPWTLHRDLQVSFLCAALDVVEAR
ncbi:MAG: peptidase M14 [Candidatus Sumerlaeia bacterium]|nr:peptidase M14 [Candidatus Sumerlaeia bacterium]